MTTFRTLVIVFVLLGIAALTAVLASPPLRVDVIFADGSVQTFVPAPATQPVQVIRSRLGVNLDGLSSSSTQHVFIDAMKSARKFGTFNNPADQAAPLDADGWPTSATSGVVVFADQPAIAGSYTLSFEPPTARASLVNSGASKIDGAKVIIPPGQSTLMLRFEQGPVRNVRLLRPGYDSDAGIFTDELLTALEPFGPVRLMDLLRTNSSSRTTWESCPRISDATYAPRGVPYEIAVALANTAGKDLWINVPHAADDDHVRRLGDLVRGSLRPELHCYVEYSNEVWNSAPDFLPQRKFNIAAAQAEAAAGDTSLTDGGTNTIPDFLGWKRVAKRTIEIRRLMAPPGDTRFRFILASQISYGAPSQPGYMARQQLEYVAKYHGPPADFFYAISGAPYFSVGKVASTQPALTPAQYADAIYANAAAGWNENCKAFRALADKYGVKFVAYEGGLHDARIAAGESMLAGQMLERTGAAVEKYLNTFFDGGGDEFFYFVLASRWSRDYAWGLAPGTHDLNVPKYAAAKRVATTRRFEEDQP